MDSNNEENKKIKIPKVLKVPIYIFFFILIFLIFSYILSLVNTTNNNSNENMTSENIVPAPIVKYNVIVHIDFVENILFNKYNVNVSIDDTNITINHGEDKDLELSLEEGSYTMTIISSEDSSIKNETIINVKNNMEIGYKIECYSDRIAVTNLYEDIEQELKEDEVKINYDKSKFYNMNYTDAVNVLKESGFNNIKETPMYDIYWGITTEGTVESVLINGEDTYKRGNVYKKDSEIVVSYHSSVDNDPNKKVVNAASTNVKNVAIKGNNNAVPETKKEEIKDNNAVSEIKKEEVKDNNNGASDTKKEEKKIEHTYYSTNTEETVRNGNSGKYAYVSKNKFYSLYYIIDFDNNCIYNFTYGNGEDNICFSTKIKSGDLNNGIKVEYKDKENEWLKAVHFKYVNQPYTLVLIDNDGFDWEYSATSIDDALKLLKDREVHEL